MDWRDEAADLVIALARGKGMSCFRYNEVEILIRHLAPIDRKKRKEDRKGIAYIADYKEAGFSQFMNLVKSRWPSEPLQGVPMAVREDGKLECVVSAELDRDDYGLVGLRETLQKYFSEHAAPAEVEILDICRSFGAWYDLKIAYRKDLSLIYQLVANLPWSKRTITKTTNEYGKATAAILN